MIAYILASRRFSCALAIPLGIVIGVAMMQVAGLGDNAQLLGIPLGKQTVPQPAGDWLNALKAEAAAHELTDWQIESSKLGFDAQPRRAYYRAKLAGEVHDKPVLVDVELQASDGGEWQLKDWSER